MNRKSERKQSLALVLILILLLTAAAIFVWMRVFVVRNVIVQGAEGLPEQEIVRSSRIQFGKSIHAVDENDVRKGLESSGKYSLDSMEKHWPDTIVLEVRQRTRDAVILNAGRYLVLDADGVVVEICTAMPQDSGVYVYGLEATRFSVGRRVTADEEKLRAMKCVLQSARSQGAIGYIAELNLDDLNNLMLMTRTGVGVKLGNSDRMDEKMKWIGSAVRDLENRGDRGGVLDVSSGTKADWHP